LGGQADYQSLQQFLADSPWDPAAVVRAVAERVAPEIGVEAWVLDDTGFPKDGKRSPGVKRQYSGTLGKIGNCQIGVSVHAVGKKGTVPLGWALYLPEEWCEDPERRSKAKIPEQVAFRTKPELGVELIEHAASWEVPAAAVLGDSAYGDNTELRERLQGAGREYVLSVSAETTVFGPETTFAVPPRDGQAGRPRSRLRPDRKPESIGKLIEGIGPDRAQTVTFRDGPAQKKLSSRFIFVRVRAAHRWQQGTTSAPREEWLIAEWPAGAEAPPTTGSPTCPRTPHPSASRAWPGCAGGSSSTTSSSRASSASTTTRGAPGSAGTTTRRSSPPPTASSRSNGYTQKPDGRPDAPRSGATAATTVQVLGRSLPDLPSIRRPRSAPAPLDRWDK
jgi:hypothetical protein